MYTLKSVFHDISQDYRRYIELESTSVNKYLPHIFTLIFHRGLYVPVGYRIKRWLQTRLKESKKTRLLWKIVKSLYTKFYQLYCLIIAKTQMPNSADIGPGLYISSRGNIIMGLTRGGKNLTIHGNVTIGMDLGGTLEPPTIGDNVCINSNCVVTSNQIGDSVVVKANSVLTKKVASNLILGGNPARVVKEAQIDTENQKESATDQTEANTDLITYLKSDVQRYTSRKSSKGSHWTSMLRKPGLQAIIVHRIGASISKKITIPVLAPFMGIALLFQRLLHHICRLFYGININNDVQIGKAFSIGHFGGITIEKCVIGDGCNVAAHVTIKCIDSENYPVIGNRVWIGSNAVIIGNVKIGSGSTISAGSYVTQDVSAGSLVAGNPARVISVNFDNSNLF